VLLRAEGFLLYINQKVENQSAFGGQN